MNKTQLAYAFVVGESGKCHNAHTDGNTYTLHDSQIVRKVGDQFVFDWCGWYTPTTASHMNEVLRALDSSIRVSATYHKNEDIKTFNIKA